MPVRVSIDPELFGWALERARKPQDEIDRRFPQLERWIRGETQPTLRQAEAFAHATYTPLGMLLLPKPPQEPVPIPDFRTLGDEQLEHPSANLLDTIYLCQQRQDWYREYARANDRDRLSFVGSLSTSAPVADAATTIREAVDFGLDDRRGMGSWSEALRTLIEHAESVGILVMVSGIVGSNTRRILDPEEFRGFALADELAPVIFVNGTDTKAAQIFTVTHELAHIWLGQSAVSDARTDRPTGNVVEQWCNAMAAEFLVPMGVLRRELRADAPLLEEAQRLAARFRVSTLVMLRRLRDADVLTIAEFAAAFAAERERVMAIDRERSSGGNFFNTLPVRASKRFTQAIVGSTLEGQTLYRDAFRLLGFRKQETFDKLSKLQGFA
jgi:Zn-dependent peptidase ImmA (M78 family)